jgi:hypothetical protein
VPSGQDKQVTLRVVAANWPKGQTEQLVDPDELENRPAGQGTQEDALFALKVPNGQIVQLDEFARLYSPPEHALQLEAPGDE